MKKDNENCEYAVTEKDVNGMKVRELRPIKTPEQDKADREHTTRLCIKALEKYKKI